MVRAAVTEACLLELPDVDNLSSRMLASTKTGSGPFATFHDSTTNAWTRFEPWMTTVRDRDTG
ncbi:hypothetical protein ARTSIC4J27_956 [Pseudarthrobacter siccitolerans]|uniref:Uncharacterized protein n=2 Tax=Pseudarthrobacter siccitolerans TaxID=861266 RepID=A0A024GZV7_9MICC|nr:hypothetical protein ARTSIC4J27_956 [Pseudarthrobacter siccitolerans]